MALSASRIMKQEWPEAQGSRRKATESHRAQSNS